MLIEEHLKGTIYIPINKGSDDNPDFEIINHDFTEDDIIHGSCSITSRCCDDQTFSIGGVRPAELALKLRLELPDVNAYTLYGAKIRLYSAYHTAPVPDDKWLLRGEFWVTSVKRTKTVYSLRASDAIIWLDSGSYATNYAAESKVENNPIYQVCVSLGRSINGNLEDGIFSYVNETLKEMSSEEIKYKLYDDITNGDNGAFALLPVDVSGAAGSCSPRDYAAHLTQLAAGCMQVLADPDSPDEAKIFVTPYGYEPQKGSEKFKASWKNTIEIQYDDIELDSCDIADYELYIHMVYTKTYDETGWSCGGTAHKYSGNIVVDLSGNPFLDGRWYNWGITNGVDELIFSVMSNIGTQLSQVHKRPFSLKCHHAFKSLEEMPKLGQKIKIEEKPGEWKESFITKMIWHFRGGWEFGSAGSDSRVLSQASKRSLASHAEDNAKTYANISANTAASNVNSRVTFLENFYDGELSRIWDRLSEL